MAIAQGTKKEVRTARQTAKGTIAATGGGQVLRRESAVFELQKEVIDTASEITKKRQITSVRHGVKVVNGSLSGILSPGTYADWLSSLLMRDYAAVTAITGASITISGASAPYTVARGSGSFLTDGIKVGMVVRLTAGAFNANNLNKNLLVTAVTALNLTVRPLNPDLTLTAEGPIATATVSVPGKVTYVPETGHTNIYHTVEEWYPDVSYSERNQDVKITQADLALPGTGNATVSFSAIGLIQTDDTAVYFTAPTAETTTDVVQAASGVLLVNGTPQAVVTDLNISINGNGTAADGVVGSTTRPDVFMGKVAVTGSFTAYFEDGTTPGLFQDETQTSIVSALAAGSEAAANFLTFTLSAVKLTSATPDDAETGTKRTYNFTAVYNSAGGAAAANHATTLMVQDSAAA